MGSSAKRGEAQAAHLVKRGDADYCASQDYDSLLFGAPRLVRNVIISGRRKLPSKNVYIEVIPEVVELESVLRECNITYEQLIDIGILIGTDFNPDGVKGLGPKTALKLIKEHGNIENAMQHLKNAEFPVEPQRIREIFLNPKVTDNYKIFLYADGLKAFAEFKRKLSVPLVLTPHAGEYAILTGKKLPEDLKEKVAEVQKTAAELDAVILLKGPVDVISDGKRFKLNFTGNPGMTVGGTGDVLSGIVGAFLAQQNDPFEAAVAGAFVNGAAGDFVFAEKGYHMVATDLINWVPRVLNDPISHLQVQKTSAKRS